jgi:hypothetical protein
MPKIYTGDLSKLVPFRSDIPAHEQCKVGDKIILIESLTKYDTCLKKGGIFSIIGFASSDDCVEINQEKEGYEWCIIRFAPLPSEPTLSPKTEKSFSDLTLGEVIGRRVKAKSDSTERKIVNVYLKFDGTGSERPLDVLIENYILLSPIQEITRAEAEEKLGVKIVD